MRRAFRPFMVGAIAASFAIAASAAYAGDPAVPRPSTLTIPKRHEAASPNVTLGSLPTHLDGLTGGNGLGRLGAGRQPETPPRTVMPLSGESRDRLPLSAPLADTSTTASTSADPSALRRQGSNILYNVIPNGGFTPYVGLGAGGATGKLDSSAAALDGLHSYEGLAGFAYKVDKDTSLDFDYRMTNTQRPTVPMDDNPDIADAAHDRAAILSLHYNFAPTPMLARPPR